MALDHNRQRCILMINTETRVKYSVLPSMLRRIPPIRNHSEITWQNMVKCIRSNMCVNRRI